MSWVCACSYFRSSRDDVLYSASGFQHGESLKRQFEVGTDETSDIVLCRGLWICLINNYTAARRREFFFAHAYSCKTHHCRTNQGFEVTRSNNPVAGEKALRAGGLPWNPRSTESNRKGSTVHKLLKTLPFFSLKPMNTICSI